MARREVANRIFSKAARRCSGFEKGWYCFEEDCAAAVAIRELIDWGLIVPPVNEYWKAGEYERSIDKSVQRYHLDYWNARVQDQQKKRPDRSLENRNRGEAR